MTDNVDTEVKHEIIRISKDVSTRICTAQVVVTLSGAIRQLVDNSIDAEATTIDVRVKNNGFESIEVVDDGKGIEPTNFNALCKPHSTSKLTDFSDFRELSTLGFRGEALNALCALGNVTIITRCASSLLGSRLRFNHQGEIAEQTNVARPIGTTVTVENLFVTLPVRRKEFERTNKREFARVLTTIQCFALCRPGIRFICSNTVAGKRQQSICTPGKADIREVVVNLFGGRSDKNKMLDVVRTLPDDDVAAIYGLNPDKTDDYENIQLSGFVSSCEHGFGRSAADRQFVYINERPVDYHKVCRVVNEVYQQYNRSQFPTVVLFIGVPKDAIDVNVTPDKRTVFFEHEKLLLALVRASLLATFQPHLGTYTSVADKRRDDTGSAENEAPLTSVFDLLKDLSQKKTPGGGEPMAKRSRYDVTPSASQQRLKTLEQFAFKLIPHTASSASNPSEPVNGEGEPSEIPASRELNATPMKRADSFCDGSSEKKRQLSGRKSSAGGITTPRSSATKKTPDSAKQLGSGPCRDRGMAAAAANLFRHAERLSFTPPALTNLSRGFDQCTRVDDEALDGIESSMSGEEGSSTPHPAVNVKTEPPASQEPVPSTSAELPAMASQLDEQGNFLRPQQTIPFNAGKLAARMADLKLARKTKQELATQQASEFQSAINPDENEKAERELDRVLKKSDFADMSIVGQFNNGFIVTRLRDHLFIVDQHASDEKYNFERFQRKARVDQQKLLTPQSLDFGAVQEGVLRDNLSVFRANGFDFEFRDQENGSTKAFLTSVPVLNSWQFDKNDIDEILSVVSEFPGEMYRPAKLRRIFASRACRKSVMIGTTLQKKQMLAIVQHLGTLDQPWNCPHGRPTLRHLFDLKNVNA